MTCLVSIALLGVLTVQGPSTTPAPAGGAPAPSIPAAIARPTNDWQELDRVVMIVNQDILPMGRMMRDLERYLANRPRPSKSEMQRLQTEIQTLHVRNSLAAQAGQDLGADEKLVDRIVGDHMERQIADHNGVAGMAAFLESQRMTTEDMRRNLREQLYGEAWEETVTGRGTGVGARASKDRWIRPGLRKFHYENAVRHEEALAALGGRPETWKLQILALPCANFGGPDKTTELARDLKRQIEEGADMSELVQRYRPSDKERGLVEGSARAIRANDKAIAAFAATAAEAAVSEPLPLQTDQGDFVRLVRLVARDAAVRPEFASPTCQEALVENAQKDLDGYRLERAYVGLFRSAYVWPEELKQSARRR